MADPDITNPGAPEFQRSNFASAQEQIKVLEAMQKQAEATFDSMAKGLKKGGIKPEFIRGYARVIRKLKEARMEMPALGKAMDVLATKFQGQGGLGGAFTKFAGVAANMVGKVDETTGAFKLLGSATTLTAGKFGAYVATIQAVVGATVALLDHVDKHRIRQAGFIKDFGALGNISIEAPFIAQAKGIAIAGEAGEDAAERLFSTITKMRSASGDMELGPERTGGTTSQFEQLTVMTTGILSKTPEYLKALREVFAMKPGEGMTREIKKIAHVAFESQVPIEQFADQVFALGAEFVNIGMTTRNSIDLLSRYGDAIGKTELPMQMVIDFARQSIGELHTGAGVTKLFTAAHFATQGFSGLDKDVQNALNKAARNVSDGKKDWGGLTIGQRAAAFENMGEGEYSEARGDIFRRLIESIQDQAGGQFGMGGQIAKILSVLLTGQEWKAFKRVAISAGGPAADKNILYRRQEDAIARGDMESAAEIGAEIAQEGQDFTKHIYTVSESLKEWYTPMTEAWAKLMGTMTGLAAELTGMTVAAAEKVGSRAAAERVLGAQLQSHPELLIDGKLTRDAAATLPGGTENFDRITKGYTFSETQRYGKGLSSTNYMPLMVETEYGTFEIIVNPIPGGATQEGTSLEASNR